ncbi:MAG: insulinase family protein [Treponema sp.]|jgi:Zn-dependent M16 (insulinase) family peptidase|nr:insulinase family protein [Treponema sp.]
MKTKLRTGQVLDSGFEIRAIVDLAELNAEGIWAWHRKSGAEVFHVLNDDKENLFAFAFATPPEDSTGVAHILEHSVLCGSTQYPLKDAFLVLAQGSLQTFLNAWTFPDKTVYPASSINEDDYFNLMSVYADAVFRPLLSEWTFMQEGHRLMFRSPESSEDGSNYGTPGLSITGVVYNEMKGAYSSPDAYGDLWATKAVLPDTPYSFESGGDPECIPDLTMEALREFHRNRYSPANCRIFLAGNIATEKQLAFLDHGFLSVLPPGKAAPLIPRAKPWTAPQTFRVPCPAGAERKSTVLLSWLCGDITNGDERMALSALAEILLGHDGSPLTRTLIESGLGEDLAPATGLEGELREMVFTMGLRGCMAPPGEERGIEAQVQQVILETLQRLVREGIPQAEIEAALLSMEFANREIRRSQGPWSLVWLRRSLRGWLHGGKPWESLCFVPGFTELKRRLGDETGRNRYFESLIQKYLLDNPHRALIVIEPEPSYLEKQEAALTERLSRHEAALSEAEKQAIQEKAAELERIQEAGERPEALATIPHLARKDLSPEIEIVPRELRDAQGTPVITHDLFTNGITYTDFAFPLDVFAPEDYPWLPLFSRVVGSLGLPGMDYGEVSSLLARTVGDFHVMLQTGSTAPGASRTVATPSGILDVVGRDWLIYRLKALDEKTGPALDLALRLIVEADFSDLRRIRDLVLEMKNVVDSSLAPAGHTYAALRSGRYFSRAKAVEEIWSGLSQLEFIHKIAPLDTTEISAKLAAIRDTLVSKAGLITNITGSAAAVGNTFRGIEERFSRFGPPRPRNPASESSSSLFSLLDQEPVAKPEVYVSPSLQVGFAAVTLPTASFAIKEHAAELVLAHQLSTGALWEDIRMRGGAYGAFAHPDNLEGTFSLSTYRDPNPCRSLDAFAAILQDAADHQPDEEFLEKAIIGSFAKETRPRTSAEKGITDCFRFLYGIEAPYRAKKLKHLVNVSADAIAAVAGKIVSHVGSSAPVIVAGTGAVEKTAAKQGFAVKVLPV